MEINFLTYKMHEYNLESIAYRMEIKIDEAKLKEPKKDFSDQEAKVNSIRESIIYFRHLFNECEALKRSNDSITLSNVKVAAENLLFKAEIDKLKKVVDEIGV